jgi:hypothetical protein
MDKKQAMKTLQKASDETLRLRTESPSDPLISTDRQLHYLVDALERKNDRTKLSNIMFWQYAVHEFENIEPAYAELLHKASAIADLMKSGEL